MKRFQNRSMKPVSSIAVGLMLAIVLSVLFGLIVTAMLNNGTLTEGTSAYVIFALHLLVSFLGALTAGKITKQKYAIVCTCVAAAYCAVLLAATIFLFDSQFAGIGKGIAPCFIGAIAACAACMIKKKRKMKKI